MEYAKGNRVACDVVEVWVGRVGVAANEVRIKG
jgi:hypothetical protein